MRGEIMETRKLWPATTILRSRVRTRDGDEIGKVEDLVLDPATQRLDYAVLSLDGYPELFIVPWSMFDSSRWPDYLVVSSDQRSLERGPTFDPADWPEITDPAWDRRVREYYGTGPAPAPVYERTVRRERDDVGARGASVLGAALMVVLLLGLLWMTFLVSTRGWDAAKNQLAGFFSGAAYAMKESGEDAALTAKVKSALSLNARVPAGKIDVDSKDGVVTLRGEVPNEETRSLAEQIAKDTAGVREVHNHLFALQRTQ
jgi:hypothetical protein